MKNAGFGVLGCIGETHLIIIKGVYAKLENVNPSGSIKDRVTLEIIKATERERKLKRGITIVEVSTGTDKVAQCSTPM